MAVVASGLTRLHFVLSVARPASDAFNVLTHATMSARRRNGTGRTTHVVDT